MARSSTISDQDKAAFLEALAETGNVGAASRAVGVSRIDAHAARRDDTEFAAAWAGAWDAARDIAHDRARPTGPVLVPASAAAAGLRTAVVTPVPSAVETLEAEARRRALEGVEENVYYQGAVIGRTRKYSDTMLMFLLRAYRPDIYRERRETDDKDDGPVIGRVTLYLPDNGRDDTADPEPGTDTAPGDAS